jgi:hypothetical protein
VVVADDENLQRMQECRAWSSIAIVVRLMEKDSSFYRLAIYLASFETTYSG